MSESVKTNPDDMKGFQRASKGTDIEIVLSDQEKKEIQAFADSFTFSCFDRAAGCLIKIGLKVDEESKVSAYARKHGLTYNQAAIELMNDGFMGLKHE